MKVCHKHRQEKYNHLWDDTINLEIDKHHHNSTSKDVGEEQPPKGYKNACAYFVFDVKYDGRYNAILVADRHITDAPLSSACLGAVFLR